MPVPHATPARPDAAPRFRRLILPTLVALALGGCATREFVTQEIGQSNARVSSMEAWFKALNQGLDSQANRLRDLEARQERAEQTDANLTSRLEETRAEASGTVLRQVRLSGEVAGMKQRGETVAADAVRAHERLDAQEARLAGASRRLEGAVAGLSAAESRIQALERQAPAAPVAVAPPPVRETPKPEAAAVPVAAPAVTVTPAQPAAPAAPGVVTPAPASAKAEEIERLNALVAELRRTLEQQSARLSAAVESANQQLGSLHAQTARLGAQVDANTQAIGRIDGRVGGIGAELEHARRRVEAGEKGLAESGLRLTLVQDLLVSQGERLARNEAEAGRLSGTAREALERARQAGKLAEGKLVFEATLTDEVANFGFEDARLNAAARKQLTELADRLKAENKGAYIEIQGHTDNVGPAEANQRLSRERALAVRDFLHQAARIPLHLLAVAGYGETRPVASNHGKEGRARNRRVVLVVLR